MSVTIIDLGYGNLGSIRLAFERLGAHVEVSADPEQILAAERLVLPGVGAAGFAMQRLRALRLDQALCGYRRPFLGICLGMQLLYDWSEESGATCLGIVKGNVRRLKPAPGRPIPHMGWSALTVYGEEHGLKSRDYVYFAHSFACDVSPYSFAHAQHGTPIPAAVAKENFLGCQFHPERSGPVGARFLQSFLAS